MASSSTGSSTQVSKPSEPIFGNPLGAVFSNLFGVPIDFNAERGGFVMGGQPGSKQGSGMGFANPLFNKDSFNSLGDQLQPGGQGQRGFDEALGLYDDSIMPGLEGLINTGFRTDMDPIRKQAMRQFQQETIPGLAEQFSFLGGGGQTLSSDFGSAAARSGADMGTNLGALQSQLDEAAAGRRVSGMELGGLLAGERADMGQMADEQILADRPGGMMLGLLDSLGIIERDPIVQANYSEGTSKQSSWGAL